MSKSELQKRIAWSGLEDADVEEILRIFSSLPPKRQAQILDRWDIIADAIRRRRQRIETEKEILLSGTVHNMHAYVETYTRETY